MPHGIVAALHVQPDHRGHGLPFHTLPQTIEEGLYIARNPFPQLGFLCLKYLLLILERRLLPLPFFEFRFVPAIEFLETLFESLYYSCLQDQRSLLL